MVKTPTPSRPAQPVSTTKLLKISQTKNRYFNVNKSYVKVCVNDIRYIESVREYLKISTNQQTITTKGKLSDLESEFKMLNIIRIHRSFMINLNHIGSFNHNEVWIEGQSFPIGRHYKETTITILNGMVNKV
ncbi:MAG: LytTR family transcriptional regulator [Saprospiraceae bacterium]|nr:LytTR family transcriptional regulator [Saprospiraceae bacterium]